jgi:hypothetical protein
MMTDFNSGFRAGIEKAAEVADKHDAESAKAAKRYKDEGDEGSYGTCLVERLIAKEIARAIRALLLPESGDARPLDEWREDIGPVLWWKFPVDEPPYCGTPNDLGHTVELHTHDNADGPRVAARTMIGGWPGYHTHWTLISLPSPPTGKGE